MREFSMAEEEAYYYSLEQEERTWMQEIGFCFMSDFIAIAVVLNSMKIPVDFKVHESLRNILKGRSING